MRVTRGRDRALIEFDVYKITQSHRQFYKSFLNLIVRRDENYFYHRLARNLPTQLLAKFDSGIFIGSGPEKMIKRRTRTSKLLSRDSAENEETTTLLTKSGKGWEGGREGETGRLRSSNGNDDEKEEEEEEEKDEGIKMK